MKTMSLMAMTALLLAPIGCAEPPGSGACLMPEPRAKGDRNAPSPEPSPVRATANEKDPAAQQKAPAQENELVDPDDSVPAAINEALQAMLGEGSSSRPQE